MDRHKLATVHQDKGYGNVMCLSDASMLQQDLCYTDSLSKHYGQT